MASEHARPIPNELDADQLEALASYLGLTQEALERLQALRDQVTATLTSEFAIVASDLSQLRGILGDAAAKLSGTFRVVTAGSDEMGRTVRAVRGRSDEQVMSRLGEIAENIASTTGTTVQGLQFEDMATQLLQHVDRKLSVLANMAKEMAVIRPTTETASPILRPEQLDALFLRLEYYRNELMISTRKVVQQQSLDSGEIELF